LRWTERVIYRSCTTLLEAPVTLSMSMVLGLIEATIGKILDGLIALVGMLKEKLKTVVDAIFKIFDEIRKLFDGFLDFLAARFPFLPPELMTILTFGIIAVVFVGIIKAIRR